MNVRDPRLMQVPLAGAAPMHPYVISVFSQQPVFREPP